ncbi:PPE domain-containing protein [Gordonia sp. DT30]|uniref:PPE domain-containing protein n=1 Tax=unclassified Gordonia (in: high G+C Gram-positive bacteria) TaxID=2657482 RepID=UPI003CF6AD3E
MTGFTAVRWEARTSRRLAGDLYAGPGAAPLADAAMAWTSLAGEFAGAAIEYASALARLRVHWRSEASSIALDRLAGLVGWLTEMAAQATAAAAMTEAQSLAVTVARLAMPDPAEVDLVDGLAHAASVTASVIPIAGGAAAYAERAVHDQRLRAAQVMAAYESASEPVARPWHTVGHAPELIPEQFPATSKHGPGQVETVAESPSPQPGAGIAVPTVLTASAGPRGSYTPTMPASAPAATTPAPPNAPAPSVSPVSPTVPPPMSSMIPAGDRGMQRVDAPAGDAEAVEAQSLPENWAEVAVHATGLVDATALDTRYVHQRLTLDGGGMP